MGGNHSGPSQAINSERRTQTLTVRRSDFVSALEAAGVAPNSAEGMKAQVWGASLLGARDAWLHANNRKLPHPDKLERERADYRPRNSFGGR
jgi:hypothetical protein